VLMTTNTTRLVVALDPKDVYLKNIGTISYVTNTTTIQPQPQRGGRGATPGAPGTRGGAYNIPLNTEQVFGFGGGGGGGGRGGPAPAPAPAAAQPRVVTTSTPVVKFESLKGTWSGDQSRFRFQFPNRRGVTAVVEGDKLTVAGLAYPLVFDREY